MKVIQAEVPEQLYQQARVLIEHGWFRDESDLLREALRKFLDTHRPELMERFIREDVNWGLRGKD
jgi:Arc/MetJ-type ribon-helix-helix transcriptional regulator